MELGEIQWEGVDWIHLAQDRTSGGSCGYGDESSSSIKGEEFLD